MRVATWNVNSLRARHDLVLDWVRRVAPDVLCLQETKVTDPEFPSDEFQRLGYTVAVAGQKAYNGVAIASRLGLAEVRVGLLGASPDADKRLISARTGGVQVFCCYVPNGKHPSAPEFAAKLAWYQALRRTLDAWADPRGDVVVCGDFNVARESRDVYDPRAFEGQTHFHPREHEGLSEVLAFGLHDAFRLKDESSQQYSWWDYRGGSFRRNLGMRIDYIFVSDSLASRCTRVTMDSNERAREKPSDHVPVLAEFESESS